MSIEWPEISVEICIAFARQSSQRTNGSGSTERETGRELERERGVNDNNIEQVTGNTLQRAACIKHKDNANAAAGHAARKETERCIIKIAFECKCEGGERKKKARKKK